MGRRRSVGLLAKILFKGRRQVQAPEATELLLAIEMVDRCTQVAHRVSDEAFAAGRRDGGCYRAVCGVLVFPASLTAPARSHCPPCERGSALTRKEAATRGGR
jgi:hypothetical protein